MTQTCVIKAEMQIQSTQGIFSNTYRHYSVSTIHLSAQKIASPLLSLVAFKATANMQFVAS